MALLGAVAYDPGTAATASTATALAMTALDTTNLRITFTAPSNGSVFVRQVVTQKGATTNPQIFLGVLDGSTVKGRQAPIAGREGGTSTLHTKETGFVVTGLTAGQSYTWDMAYGVEDVVASTTIGWGGPNDTTASNAYGSAVFEIWETSNLLAATLYDPGTAVQKSVASTLAMTALDTTNLRLTFSAPGSGRVITKIRTLLTGSASTPQQVMLGILDGATVRARLAPMGGFMNTGTLAATDFYVVESVVPVTGLTAGQSYTWDAAYSVETAQASVNLSYGGPDNAVANDAWGGCAFEVWSA